MSGREDGSGNESEHDEPQESAVQKLDAKYERQFESMFTMMRQMKDAVDSLQKKSGATAAAEERHKTKNLKAAKRATSPEAADGTAAIGHDQAAAKRKKGNISETSEGEISDKTDDDNDTDSDSDVLSIPDEDYLTQIDNDLCAREKTSRKVNKPLAKLVNNRFSNKLSEEKLKANFEKHLRPENCEKLVVPIVNEEVWKTLPQHAKRADVKTALIQRAVVKAATALTRSTHHIAKAAPEVKKKVYDANTEALALLGHASQELSAKRRQQLKPHLSKNLAGLCSDTVPVTTKLFGDNLSTSLKEVKELDKLSASGTQAYGGPKRGASNRRHFLGHRTNWRQQDWQYKKRGQFAFGGKTQKRPFHSNKKT